MAKLYNLARMTTATTGTGTITLGSAVSSYVTFAAAGVQNGDTVTYAIADGTNREVGRGVYTSSGTTLTRATILRSTNSNAAINLSGNAEVFITAAAEDIANVGETNTFTTSQVIEVTDNSNPALRITQTGNSNSLDLTGSTQTNAVSPRLINMAQTWNAPTIAVTSVSGNGTSVTLTHAAQAVAVPVGSTINVSGFTPTGYNTATGAVTASTTTTTTYTNATSAAVTVLGTFSVNIVTPIFLNVTNTSSAGTPSLVDLRVGNVSQFSINRAGNIVSTGTFTFGGSTLRGSSNSSQFQLGAAADTILSRPAAANWQLGSLDATAPVAYTLSAQGVVAGTTNTAGVDLTIRGSRGTGTGAGGAIILQTAPAGSSGTTQNAAAERFRVGPDGQFGIAGANYGTSGQVLTSGGASAAPSWKFPSANLIGTIVTTSGTSASISGLDLTPYKLLIVVFDGVSHNSGSSQGLLLGTSTADDVQISTSGTFSAAATVRGIVTTDLTSGVSTSFVDNFASGANGTVSSRFAGLPIRTSSTSVSVAFSAGSLDAGAVYVYGI